MSEVISKEQYTRYIFARDTVRATLRGISTCLERCSDDGEDSPEFERYKKLCHWVITEFERVNNEGSDPRYNIVDHVERWIAEYTRIYQLYGALSP